MKYWAIVYGLLIFASCAEAPKKLPILGDPVVIGKDTVYPVVPEFSFTNQDGKTLTSEDLKDQIYVADFVFLSCPTICPKMTSELKTVYEEFKQNPEVCFLSHTIDPERDTPERLKHFTRDLKIDTRKWNFLTGTKDSIYFLAEKGYFSTAYADSISPGGFVHGGGFLLVDKSRHIRGVYDGTDSKSTKRLIRDIRILLNEYGLQKAIANQ